MLKNNKGQGLIEYLIIVAIIGVGTMGIMRILNSNLNANFANIIYVLQGGSPKRVRGEAVKDSDLRKKDLGDFMNGAVGRDK